MKIKNKCDGERVEIYRDVEVVKLKIPKSVDVIKICSIRKNMSKVRRRTWHPEKFLPFKKP
jgi:hypothetical protein